MKAVETWKPVLGYEGLYEVSNLGRVRGLVCYRRWKHPRILKPFVTRFGERRYTLWRDRKEKKVFGHRLVAEAFLSDWNPKLEVDHIEGDRSRNAASDLRMATGSANHRAYRATSRSGSSGFRGVCWSKARRKWEAKISVFSTTHFLGRFASEIDAAKAYNAKAQELGFLPEALNQIPT